VTAKRLTLVSELAYVTTYFDLPSSPHFVADFVQAKCDFTSKTAVFASGPVSTVIGNWVQVQFPVWDIYLGM